MRHLHRNLEIISRILICAAVLFSTISGLTFWNCVVLRQNKDHYKPARFVVTSASFERFEDGTVDYWLAGTISGREERFFPRFGRGSRPQSSEDLLRIYPKGTEIEAVYNPGVSDVMMRNGEALRIIQAGPSFWVEESERFRWAAFSTLAPVPLAAGFLFLVRIASHRRKSLEVPHAEA